MYSHIIKPILFLFDPELMHNLAISLGDFCGRFSLTRKVISFFYVYKGRDISKTVDGVFYKVPFVLGAGFDYNARLTQILPSVGFGGVEIGSITARPCDGNVPPRLIRLPRSKSILVRKGLKNEGVESVIGRILSRKRIKDFVIGISIARTNCKEVSSVEDGIEDYARSFLRLNEKNVGDYYTINISCPNSFGGETYTTPELLRKLLSRLRQIHTTKPVYIKMPINLEWEFFSALLDMIKEFSFVKGVVIGNLNKNYENLDFRDEAPKDFMGGLSGKPCRNISTELIQKTRNYVGENFTIIGCGGVLLPEDAQEKFNAGADIIQLVTGLIYTGPALIKKSCRAVAGLKKNMKKEIAIFAAGCFWGVEEESRIMLGVLSTRVGYIGGEMKNPTYEDVCANRTGHAESVEVTFDSENVSYEKLVRKFFDLHDPTQIDRQGPDVGNQYRSGIFYHSPEQKEIAEKIKKELDESGKYTDKIATEITAVSTFWPAEEYHQQYLKKRGLNICH